MSRSSVLFLSVGVLALLAGGPASAGEQKVEHKEIEATLLAPSMVTGGEGFAVEVAGKVSTGPMSVFAYKVVRDGAWHYDEDHQVVFTKHGSALADERFNSGDSLAQSFPQDLPPGTYHYTFVFGQRSGAHGWYDVALDADVEIQAPGALCDVDWVAPKSDDVAAGKSLSLKFTAKQCSDQEFFVDEDIVVTLTDGGGGLIQGWLASSDPTTGVHVNEKDKVFHVEWATEGYGAGEFTVEVQFSTGETLLRTLKLR